MIILFTEKYGYNGKIWSSEAGVISLFFAWRCRNLWFHDERHINRCSESEIHCERWSKVEHSYKNLECCLTVKKIEFSEWGSWPDCSVTTTSGCTQIRKRTCDYDPSNFGEALSQQRSCSNEKCSKYRTFVIDSLLLIISVFVNIWIQKYGYQLTQKIDPETPGLANTSFMQWPKISIRLGKEITLSLLIMILCQTGFSQRKRHIFNLPQLMNLSHQLFIFEQQVKVNSSNYLPSIFLRNIWPHKIARNLEWIWSWRMD